MGSDPNSAWMKYVVCIHLYIPCKFGEWGSTPRGARRPSLSVFVVFCPSRYDARHTKPRRCVYVLNLGGTGIRPPDSFSYRSNFRFRFSFRSRSCFRSRFVCLFVCPSRSMLGQVYTATNRHQPSSCSDSQRSRRLSVINIHDVYGPPAGERGRGLAMK